MRLNPARTVIADVVVLLLAASFLVVAVASANRQSQERAAFAQERHDNAAERRELLRGQRDLQVKYDGLLRQQKALVEYFRAQGYDVPPEFVPSGASAARILRDSGQSTTTTKHITTRRITTMRPAPSPAPTPAPRQPDSGTTAPPVLKVPALPDVPSVPDVPILPLP